MRKILLAFLVLVLLPLAGCLADDGDADNDPTGPSSQQGSFIDRLAANVPASALQPYDASRGVTWWEEFVTTYPKRDALLPNNELATMAIAEGLRAAGLEVEVLHYAPGPLAGAPPGAAGIHVVQAMKPGRDAGHGLALGAHYDTQAATVQGAFDNGAGTAVVYELCQHLATLELNRTLVCLFFDGEELGALGSEAWVGAPPASAPDIDFYFGYDMVGINWPGYAPWKLYNWIQDDYSLDLFPIVESAVRDVLAWPADGAEVFPFNDRNSDEYNFIQAGIPTVRFAGGRAAGDYDQYHQTDDTVEHVYAMVGGRANFELGFGAIVQESTLLALMLDQTTLAEIQANSGVSG